jgi:hypothetical protein
MIENVKDILNKFYEKNVKDEDYAPVIVGCSKDEWIDHLSSGEIVDSFFVYANTMSVLLDPKGSCQASLLIINEDLEEYSGNITLRLDRDKAFVGGFSDVGEKIVLWDDFDDAEEFVDLDLDISFKLTKVMEQSIIRQLKNALSNQFKDEMFKDRLSKKDKIEVQEFLQTTIDYYDLDEEYFFNYDKYKDFVEKYKLSDEVNIDFKGNEKVYIIKPFVSVYLNRTLELFKDRSRQEDKFNEIKESFSSYVKKQLIKLNKELEFSVEGDFDSEYGELYLKFDNFEFRHEYLQRMENESSYEDAPESWTWAAWLISDESPIKDDEFIEYYQTDQLLQALDQFVHTLDESTFFIDLEKNINEES